MVEPGRYAPPTAAVADVAAGPSTLDYSIKAGRLLRLVGWLSIVLGSLFVVIGVIASDEPAWSPELTLLAIPLVLGGIYLLVGAAVKKGRPWARVVGSLLAALSLLSFPLGTVIGGFVLYYLVRGWREGPAEHIALPEA